MKDKKTFHSVSLSSEALEKLRRTAEYMQEELQITTVSLSDAVNRLCAEYMSDTPTKR